MGTGVDLSCPQCGERVLDAGRDNTWKVEKPTPPSDEELGVGD
jgi:hypothetical protein